MKTIYLLGAEDPEMRRIEEILCERGVPYAYAQMDNRVVQPGNAYRADPVPILEDGDTLVCIECRPREIPDLVALHTIDHHRPGDPGYDLGSTDYWRASSIGQLYARLGGTPTYEDRTLAAMDHCFNAALRGETPGVAAQDVYRRKVLEIAQAMSIETEEVFARTEHFRNRFLSAPEAGDFPLTVRDMRADFLGTGYSLDLLCAQVAVAIEGGIGLLRHKDIGTGPDKWTLTGHPSPELVRYFMEYWAPKHGLEHVYGAPTRGYAGGYCRR